MTKKEFWRLIDDRRSDDMDKFYMAVKDAVSALPADGKRAFAAYLGAYLRAAADCVWVDMACKVINGYVSDDAGLHFALWLIAQGEEVLLNTLKDPDYLARPELCIPFGSAEFELLMSVCHIETHSLSYPALMKKAREEISGLIRYRNGERYGGYDSFDDAMKDVPNVLPKLCARAEKAGFFS